MAKVDIFSGFLGAGKTTLIKKLISEGYDTKNIVLIENEFGEIGVDTGFLRESGIQINEMVAGCICCTLVGDFGKALNEVVEQYDPDRILIEPSGVGKLSDVIIAVQDLQNDKIELNGFTTVVDARRYKMYMENFGEFFANQVEHASSIFLSHQQGMSSAELDEVVRDIRTLNKTAQVVTTEWDQLSGAKMLEVMESDKTLNAELDKLRAEAYEELEAKHMSMSTNMTTSITTITTMTTMMNMSMSTIITTITMTTTMRMSTSIITTTITMTMMTMMSMNATITIMKTTAMSAAADIITTITIITTVTTPMRYSMRWALRPATSTQRTSWKRSSIPSMSAAKRGQRDRRRSDGHGSRDRNETQ